MPDNTPSPLQDALNTILANHEHKQDAQLADLDQILALFMECLPEKYPIDGTNWHISPDYHRAFNQAIDITAQNMRALGGGNE